MNFLFFGELMLRFSPARPGERLAFADTLRMTPGGSEANSAVALKSIGVHDTTFLSSFPNNPLGENCLRLLSTYGVKVISLQPHSDRLGLYFLDMGAGPRASEVYYDRMYSAFDKIDPESIRHEHLMCDWFHSSGVTPAISEQTCSSLFRCLELKPENVPFSLDLNFRSKLWKWADKEKMRAIYDELCRSAVLLTGNENDFQSSLGVRGAGNTQDEIYSSIANIIFSKYQRVKYLAVSLRESHSATRNSWSGMLFVRTVNDFETFVGPRIEIDSIVDRLGTGDSFTAGILHGLASYGNNYKRTIDFAVMLSALTHTIYGDFSSINEKEVCRALHAKGNSIIQR